MSGGMIHAANDNRPHTHRTGFTGDNEWYTPSRYIEMAREVMGGIDVDPASNDYAQKTVKAATYYTAETNGLDKPWHGRVWMNPPYSRRLMPAFADKMVREVRCGNASQAIVLVNNCTDTRWFDALAKAASAVCLTIGRIKFISPRRSTQSPAQGQAFFYFGSQTEAFAAAFGEVGNCFGIIRGAPRMAAGNDNNQAARAAYQPPRPTPSRHQHNGKQYEAPLHPAGTARLRRHCARQRRT